MDLAQYPLIRREDDLESCRAVDSVVRLLAVAVNGEQAAAYIEDSLQHLPGYLGKIGLTTVSYADYEFRFGLLGDMREYAAALEAAAGLGVYAAPRLVQINEAGITGVVTTWIPGLAGLPLVSCRNRETPFAASAIERLRLDFAALQHAGLVHDYAVRSISHWYEHPSTGHIMFDSWKALRPIRDEDDSAWVAERINEVIEAAVSLGVNP